MRPLSYVECAMRRVAVFMDAGYFWVQAAHVVLGHKAQRNQLSIDYQILHDELIEQTKAQFPCADLLRVYWYDGPGPNGKTPDHQALDQLDDIKLRLGTRNGVGAQKAVDGLIIADMISLAQSKAITDALLISGDADLAPGVIATQNLGIRVHLLSMGPIVASSPYLRCEADFKGYWEDTRIKLFASATPTAQSPKQQITPQRPATNAATTTAVVNAPQLRLAVQKSFDEADKAVLGALKSGDPIPKEIDKQLLYECRTLLGRALSEQEKRQARLEFRKLSAPKK